ncbi:MAG: hypothetical protein EB127_03555 [Alphaproteobacteria bacterium]|nr:hypothetical protein [Alphaproteobacteria bacterium]
MNIDSAIFIGFLVVNIIFGLASSRGIKDVKEYAIGNRDFSTATLIATIVATCVGGGMFFNTIAESYSHGLYYMWAGSGGVIYLLLVGYFFAPRLAEFLGKISIAEAMGELYGKNVRIITAIAGFIGVSGIIAMQLRVSGLLFEYCFDVPSAYGVIIGGVIVTLYSSLGGIKSVTFTDVIQFFTFGTIIPIITFFLLTRLDSTDLVLDTLSSNKSFDYNEVFDFTKAKSLYYLFLFLFPAIPGFNPPIFQRISMAKNVNQVRNSFIISGLTLLFVIIMLNWIALLLLSINPNLEPNSIVKHLIFNNSYIGLKGLTLAGIMAIVMSTADSYINSAAVLLVHDFCRPLGLNIIKNELIFSRVTSLFIGVFAMILCLHGTTLLQLIITAYSLYMPIVTVPFIMALLGFRSSGKSVLCGMGAGFVTVVAWEIFLKKTAIIDGLVPAMAANLIFLMGSHYILQQPGGWVGIKDYGPLMQMRKERRLKIKNFINACKNFNLLAFLRKNSPDRGVIRVSGDEEPYIYLGLFCMISAFSTVHTISKPMQLEYIKLLEFIHPSSLFISTLLLSYPLWLPAWRKTSAIAILWHIAIFYILICIGFVLVIITTFAPLQLIVFMANIMVVAILLKWKLALFMIISGLVLTIQFFKYAIGPDALYQQYALANIETTYIVVMISSILMAFLRPKQEYQELTEEKAEHLLGRIDAKDEEVTRALALKGEFIRNVTHEYHAPMTGVMSMIETLHDGYDKLSDAQKKSAIEVIFQSAHRLKSYDENIATLSILSKGDYNLKKEEIDLSELLLARINSCRKLYEKNKEDRFLLEIEEEIIANLDKNYITQLLDNLIINSINYCKKGKIHITLSDTKNSINLIISDEGIGIPKNELYEIFEPFTVSSKTRTPAGGRGVGLAVCKKIAEVHGGTISADSNGELGASFTVVLTRG